MLILVELIFMRLCPLVLRVCGVISWFLFLEKEVLGNEGETHWQNNYFHEGVLEPCSKLFPLKKALVISLCAFVIVDI